MSDSTTEAGSAEAGKLAAVMAAVQAFLDEEAADASRTRAADGPRRLDAWKTAPWQEVRGGGPGGTSAWRHVI